MFNFNTKEIMPTNRQINKLVVLLHGYGSNENDLLNLANVLAKQLPKTGFISVQAPQVCESYDHGYQWFSLLERDDQVMESKLKIIINPLTNFLLKKLEEFNLAANDLALVGFSQGAMVALYLALRLNNSIAAVISLSGMLIGQSSLINEISAYPPILMTQGAKDEIITLSMFKKSLSILQQAGLTIENYLDQQLAHQINNQTIDIVQRFLKKQFLIN